MLKIVNDLLGLIMPSTIAKPDTAPAAAPARMILGGGAAPELCMLASEAPFDLSARVVDERVGQRPERRLSQVKADGINAVFLEGQIIGGREGAPLDCALHCQPGLARLEERIGSPMVFFGEYVAQDGFNATLAEHKAGKGEGVFWIYDAVPHGAWVTGKEYQVPIETRLGALRASVMAAGAETGLFVGMLDFWIMDWGQTYLKARELWAAGYEGLVTKELGSGFARRRDDRWIKVKERHQAVCAVQDVLMKDGRARSFIVRSPAAVGIKPLTLPVPPSLAVEIEQAVARSNADRLRVRISFELTVGRERSIRGAKVLGLAQVGEKA